MAKKVEPACRSDLEEYGFECFATASIDTDKGAFSIVINDEAIGNLEEALYAFLIDDEVVRIGSSLRPLRNRMREWGKDVSRRLQCTDATKKMRTPWREAQAWQTLMADGKIALVFGRAGTLISTPAGKDFSAYLSEESHLIRKHLPALNWSKYR